MQFLRGSYGSHLPGARGQDAGVAVGGASTGVSLAVGGHYGGGGCGLGGLRRLPGTASAANLRPSAGIADADDVDDILQQVRRDVRAIQSSTAERAQELDGTWQCSAWPERLVTVAGGAVQSLEGGAEKPITILGAGKLFLSDQGRRTDGELVRAATDEGPVCCEIRWSGGEVWVRLQEATGQSAPSSGPCRTAAAAAAGKSLSRCQSEATWDRPTNGDREEPEVSRAAPKATVRGRYVFSGSAETQVLSNGRGIGSSYSDEFASQFSPRMPGSGAGCVGKESSLGTCASSKRLHREMQPALPEELADEIVDSP